MSWLSEIFNLRKPEFSIYKPVRKTHNRLSDRDKTLVLAHAKDGMSKSDICRYYNISLSTCYKIIREAKA